MLLFLQLLSLLLCILFLLPALRKPHLLLEKRLPTNVLLVTWLLTAAKTKATATMTTNNNNNNCSNSNSNNNCNNNSNNTIIKGCHTLLWFRAGEVESGASALALTARAVGGSTGSITVVVVDVVVAPVRKVPIISNNNTSNTARSDQMSYF